jgi:phosphate transport system substrate-binding protein
VSGLVKQTAGAIGYVELVYAEQNKIAHGAVRNANGEFVSATLSAISAAAANATIPADFRVSITNPPGKGAYPIASFTWLLIPTKIDDPARQRAITGFLRWMLTDGQGMVEALGYAKLPKALVERELKVIAEVK